MKTVCFFSRDPRLYSYETSVSVEGIAGVVKPGTARRSANCRGQIGALQGGILDHAHTTHVLRVLVVGECAPLGAHVNYSEE
jgi:hypothetical protein